jgi:hypothetical protein
MADRLYTGILGGPGGFDGYAGLVIGTRYTGEEIQVEVPSKEEGEPAMWVARIAISLPNGRTTRITPEQWEKWFEK